MILPVAQHLAGSSAEQDMCPTNNFVLITESSLAFTPFNKFYPVVVPYTVMDHEAGIARPKWAEPGKTNSKWAAEPHILMLLSLLTVD